MRAPRALSVFLDFFFDREPFAASAADILNLCEENKLKGFATPVIICNVYYLLRKTAKHEIIIEKIKQLLNIIDITSMDKEVVFGALNSKFKDFEDALQNFRDWDVVFIRVGNDFEARPLELGDKYNGFVGVKSGLKAGQVYAAGNSYLLKAELGKSGATHDH